MCLLEENLSSVRKAVYSAHLPPGVDYEDVLSATYLGLKTAALTRESKGKPYCEGDPKAFTYQCAKNIMRLRVIPQLQGRKQLRDKPEGCRKWLATWVSCPVTLFCDLPFDPEILPCSSPEPSLEP